MLYDAVVEALSVVVAPEEEEEVVTTYLIDGKCHKKDTWEEIGILFYSRKFTEKCF